MIPGEQRCGREVRPDLRGQTSPGKRLPFRQEAGGQARCVVHLLGHFLAQLHFFALRDFFNEILFFGYPNQA